MRALLLPLLLVLALPLSVAASSHDEETEDYYEYLDFKILVSPPLTLCSPAREGCPSETTVVIQLPGYGIPGVPYLKNCKVWTGLGHPERWDGVMPAMDRYRTVYGSGANFTQGRIKITVGDTAPDRESTVCLRVPFYLLGH